ncbi:MAG TPA: type II toxin-antitoxin system HigB family toxin [Verrucomicrobiota bacterium]|nr:type II toxin-antitoxin system HigB family toxin [Verrucomicrobiota bacterium]HRZ35217.1 type II toxin-antitoxin system HigB family toxin [Candidatus Paceibacterota bacterium]HRZ54159.1 type II toxin-antitoxin system HigB family toxin [Candidatus Paceibacterota bacterium]
MRVIKIKTLLEFWQREPAAQAELQAWYAEAKEADWQTPAELKMQFGNASILKGQRVVFNICGNKYRLVVRINYPFRVIYIRFIGTHAEYDRIDVETV